jgi:hypothetical protein
MKSTSPKPREGPEGSFRRRGNIWVVQPDAARGRREGSLEYRRRRPWQARWALERFRRRARISLDNISS